MANKHTIIVIASIIVIAGSVGYSSLNVVSVKDLEFSWPGNSFDYFSMLTGKTLEVCNNSALPASFSKYSFKVFYNEQDLGTFSTGSGGLAPHTDGLVFGKFETANEKASNLFLSFLDTETSGTDVSRINVNKIKVTSQLDTTILWVIPYSITQEYTSADFLATINKEPSCAK